MILSARWVLPIVRAPICDGYVQIQAGRIAAVGPLTDLTTAVASDDERIDLGATVLLPGLVNPHTHLELTGYSGKIAPQPLWSWLRELIALRRAPGAAEREAQAVADGAWQSLRAGVTCVGDISRTGMAWRALKPIPIRKVCFVELLSLATEPPRDVAELQRILAAVDEDELLLAGVSPHAPYSVRPDAFRDAVRLAKSLRRAWTSHWAETAEEARWICGDADAIPAPLAGIMREAGLASPRAKPRELLRAVAGESGGLLAHMNYVEPGDIEAIASAKRTIVYCPRAHRFFGHPPHAWRQMQAAGIAVVIGTDSLASNNSLSVLDELRFLRRIGDSQVAGEEWLRMITLDAAAALGLDHQIGSLSRGKWADLAAFRVGARDDDPYESVLRAAEPALGVWVGGTRVV